MIQAHIPLSIPAGLLQSTGLTATFVAQFCLFFALILAWTLMCGITLERWFKLPRIAGYIIGGIALGPSCIDVAHLAFFSQPLTMVEAATGSISTLLSSDLFVFCILLMSSAFTVSYLLWVAGHETDIHEVKQVGLVAIVAGFLGAILPLTIIGSFLYSGILWQPLSALEACGMGLIFSATSVSIPVAMLTASGRMHLKSSKATLAAAVVDDIVAVILLSVFFVLAQTGFFGKEVSVVADVGHQRTILASIGDLVASLVLLILCGYYIVRPAVRWLKEHNYGEFLPAFATCVMLVYFGFAEIMGGLAGITGAYFAGLFHRMGDGDHYAQKLIFPFVEAILLPIFLGSIGLLVDVHLLRSSDWLLVLLLLVLAIATKLFGCFVATTVHNASMGVSGAASESNRWSLREGYLFGSAMVARGEVGLVIATLLHGARILALDQYVVAVVVITLTTIATPLMLAAGFAPLQKSIFER